MSAMMDIDSSDTISKATKLIPWVEKYRPETVDEVSHQDEVVRTLKRSIEQGSLPHLLFHGPPGTGKTTTILAVARAMYGPELYRQRILELNASDERGISVVREKIKSFAQGAVGNHKTLGYPCPKFKLIILDEADTMTPDAQSALRRIMETYAKVTRFCLICNYVTRVIEPLASRCAKFRFKPLPVDSMISRIKYIAESERVNVDRDALDAILKVSGGDMRKAVTYLQSAHQLCAGNSSTGASAVPVSAALVIEISGQVPPENLQRMLAAAAGPSFDAVRTQVVDLITEGYPMAAVLSQIHDEIVANAELNDIDKALICERIAQSEQHLLDGSSEVLQLTDLMAFIMRRYRKFESSVDNLNLYH